MVFLKEVFFDCPFCKAKETVKAVERPSYKGFKTSRGSGKSDTYAVHVEGDYTLLTGCAACGNSSSKCRRALFGDK